MPPSFRECLSLRHRLRLPKFYVTLHFSKMRSAKNIIFALQQWRIIYTIPVTTDSSAAMKRIDQDSGAAGARTAPIAGHKNIAAQKVVNLALQGGGTHGAFTWACSIGCSTKSALRSKASRPAAPAR
jgi:hypothetical protein